MNKGEAGHFARPCRPAALPLEGRGRGWGFFRARWSTLSSWRHPSPTLPIEGRVPSELWGAVISEGTARAPSPLRGGLGRGWARTAALEADATETAP